MNATTPSIPPLLLDAIETAKALRLSEKTLWSLTKAKKIPHVRIGRRVLYDPRDLHGWIDGQKQSVKPIEENAEMDS